MFEIEEEGGKQYRSQDASGGKTAGAAYGPKRKKALGEKDGDKIFFAVWHSEHKYLHLKP